jgi:hypothetical protein
MGGDMRQLVTIISFFALSIGCSKIDQRDNILSERSQQEQFRAQQARLISQMAAAGVPLPSANDIRQAERLGAETSQPESRGGHVYFKGVPKEIPLAIPASREASSLQLLASNSEGNSTTDQQQEPPEVQVNGADEPMILPVDPAAGDDGAKPCPTVCATACASASAYACAFAEAWACVFTFEPFKRLCTFAKSQSCTVAMSSVCTTSCTDGTVIIGGSGGVTGGGSTEVGGSLEK